MIIKSMVRIESKSEGVMLAIRMSGKALTEELIFEQICGGG